MRPSRLMSGLGLAAIALSACGGHNAAVSGPQSGDQGYVSGDGTVQLVSADHRVAAPPIEGAGLNGGVIDIRNEAGRVVLLNFWASWCGPCRTEQPKLNSVYAAEHAHGVDFIGVNIRDDDVAARAFERTHAIRYPSIIDHDTAIPLEFDPRLPGNPPSTIVIDRDGRVAAKILGPVAVGVLQPILQQLANEPVS